SQFTSFVEAAPTLGPVSPSSGAGLTQKFNFSASSPGGPGNFATVYILFNQSFSFPNACYLRYNVASREFFLVKDSGSGYEPSEGRAGHSQTLSNSQCSVNMF